MDEGLPKVSIPITGMSCAACARRVEKALSGVGGVASAGADLATEEATVEYDPASADEGSWYAGRAATVPGRVRVPNPVLAAAAMALSSVTVLTNALRPRRARIY